MKIKDLLNVLHVGIEFDSDERITDAVKFISIVQEMSQSEKDVIMGSFEHGPLWDGDIPSKSGRDSLLDSGFISKVVVKGEEGYNACTYKGARAYRVLKEMSKNTPII